MNKIPFDHRPAWVEPGDEKPSLNRRAFLTTSVAVGFAAAVQPVMAQVIHTDSDGIVAGQVMVPVKDGRIPAYRAYPAKGTAPFPTVIVVHEIFGVHEHIQDVARRLAKLGYYAIVPDLYSRAGDVAKMEKMDDVMAVVRATPDAQVLSDLDSTVDYLGTTGQSDTKRLGITGFCWGGRVTWLYSAHNPQKVKAGVAWYGPLASSDPQRPSAISLASTLEVPVLGLYAGKDGHITADDVTAMKMALKDTKSEIVVYADADHGFNADYRPSYNKADAEDGWKRLRAWFKANGVV
jgi:carboxymethylenebutenolidase